MATNYANVFYKDYEKLSIKFEKQEIELKKTRESISKLTETIAELTKVIEEQNKTIKEQADEILRLKSKSDKDSSNSSKPSSTNGYKKVITSRREKSDKPKGAVVGHIPHTLTRKIDNFLNSGDIVEEIIEVNKTEDNKNKRYIEKVVIDVVITKVIKKYRYYPDKYGKYNIPVCHNQYFQYGNNLKSICLDLMVNLSNSTDGVARFISDITNYGITLSKGTLINWTSELSEKLIPQINNIEDKLLDSYFINHDESQIKVNGDGYNVLCACNNKYVRLWCHKHKSQEALDEIGFLPKFKGVIIKDGTELYNKYGCFLAQCISHIQRYLKGIYDYIGHKGPKNMAEFFSKYNDLRNSYIEEGKDAFTEEEYNNIISEYDEILDLWEKELREDINNYLFDDECNLFTRLKYDNKQMDNNIRGDRDEILYFLKDFRVPSTNNNAESSQRGVKIKQKIGKFRSVDGTQNYLTIKSCILTYKKQGLDVLKTLKSAFDNNPVIA